MAWGGMVWETVPKAVSGFQSFSNADAATFVITGTLSVSVNTLKATITNNNKNNSLNKGELHRSIYSAKHIKSRVSVICCSFKLFLLRLLLFIVFFLYIWHIVSFILPLNFPTGNFGTDFALPVYWYLFQAALSLFLVGMLRPFNVQQRCFHEEKSWDLRRNKT